MARPLRVGIQLPEVERDVRWPEYVSMAKTAEAAGFDSIWLGDHLLYRDDGGPERGPWEAWTLLTGLAAITERVRLGPLVACLAFHPPGLIAKMAATVNEVSGGRFVLGVGAGWNEAEFRAFGIPFDHRFSRFEEAFAIVHRLISGERVTAAGRFWSAADAVILPPARRRPTLMVGSTGERVLAATLPYVDVWNTWFDRYGNTAEGFADLNAGVSEAVTRSGRAPAEVSRSACVLVMLDPRSGERIPDGDVVPLEGSPERIVKGLRGFAEAGADEVILVASPITEGSIRELGRSLALLDAGDQPR